MPPPPPPPPPPPHPTTTTTTVLPRSADGSVDLDRRDACYDTSKRIVIKIVDTCPCQGNEVGALPCSLRTFVCRAMLRRRSMQCMLACLHALSHRLFLHAPPGPAPPQKWCCGDAGLVHFDLSDGAFRKLAPQVRG